MKILPVNTKIYQFQKNSSNSFKGLWGRSESMAYAGDPVSNTIIVKHYYPFKDESKENIEKIVKQNSFHFEADNTYNDISVKTHTLPFSEKEYNVYMSKKVIEGSQSEPAKSIESYLKQNGLKEFLNKNRISSWKLKGLIAEAVYPKNPVKRLLYRITHYIKV